MNKDGVVEPNFANPCQMDVMRIFNDHSTKIVPPMTARTAVKPKLTGVEMAPLSFGELLLSVLLALAPVPVADPVEPPELVDGLGKVELVLDFSALAWKAAKVLFSFALTAKTIPLEQ